MKPTRIAVGGLLAFAGVMHFLVPGTYEEMMPDWLPLHREAVLVSGLAEIIGGIALMVERWKRFGCWWSIAVLIAVFPANIQMALTPDQVDWIAAREVPGWLLWIRLALQPALMLLIWWACGRPHPFDRQGAPGDAPS